MYEHYIFNTTSREYTCIVRVCECVCLMVVCVHTVLFICVYIGRYTFLTCATRADSPRARPSHPYFLGKSPTKVDNRTIRGDSLFCRNNDGRLSIHQRVALATRLRTSPCLGGFHTVQCTVDLQPDRTVSRKRF